MQKPPDVDRQIWFDGELVPWREATVHVLSHSLQRGSLVFDYMSLRATPRGEALFRLRAHLRRLLRSCELMGLPISLNEEALHLAVLQTVRANPGARAVKVSAFLPSVEVDVVPVDLRVSVAIAAYDPATDILSRLPGEPKLVTESVRLRVETDARQRREDIVSPEAKVSANYVSSMIAKSRAQREGFDDILLLDEDGFVAEGPTTNIFIVDRAGVLKTPPEHRVLRGVTRASVIELAQDMDIPVEQTSILPAELSEAAEAFITGTTSSVLAVEAVDGKKIGQEWPGATTLRLRDRLEQIKCGEDAAFEHWLTFVDEAEA